MGLDMYLYREIFIGANFNSREISGAIDIKTRNTQIPINLSKVSTIIEVVCQWHKNYQIHKWFVENVCNGECDCKKHRLTNEQLAAFKDFCRSELTRKGEFLQAGVSSDDVEDYMYDLRKSLNELAQYTPDENVMFFFRASY